MRSAIIAPITTRGRTLGAMTFVSGRSGRRYIVGNPLFLLRVLKQRLSRVHYDARRGGGA